MDEQSMNGDLAKVPRVGEGDYLTTNQGGRIGDNQNSLRAGARGPTLLEDFQLREKITHFDHERIPERVVHARGSGAHGSFQVYESMAEYTMAKVLQDPSVTTPVFVRFSTVSGARGSADTARDARGFAVKFYTEEGVWDLVSNNIPVFFIQDTVKFPDLVHAFKPEPHHEIPGASTAHDTFWDSISLTPESMHMIMWVMSDRGIPRSLSMMEGFGVNTFRFVNEQGVFRLVKFHWKPVLGVHSLVWDEAVKLAGRDPDFHRRDLWDAIEKGDYPEFELAVQLIDEADELSFDFDPLDATKIWPEELVPVKRVGKMTLNRNPENFFAETEQVAFHPGHVVPGIDFSNDPLLQGRLFSYLDTQINRFGSPNFAQIPINQPHAAVNNNNQDGHMRYRNKSGRVNYEPNMLNDGRPMEAPREASGYVSYPEQVSGPKVRQRSPTFADHYTQAAMFWRSQSPPEQDHIVEALQFELSKVETREIRERMVMHLARIDDGLAARVAPAVGVSVPSGVEAAVTTRLAPETSMANTVKDTAKGRRVAILVAAGVDGAQVTAMKTALSEAGVHAEVVAKHLGTVVGGGQEVAVDKTIAATGSVMYDAVYIPGGQQGIEALKMDGNAVHFVTEAFKHCKPLAAIGEAVDLVMPAVTAGARNGATPDSGQLGAQGVFISRQSSDVSALARQFIQGIAQHRFFNREQKDMIPA